jgi:hypothetical protein
MRNLIGDSANFEHYSFERTFFKTKRHRMTALTGSQRNEVLFFANAHFLFFNFIATAQNTLSFFLPTHEPTAEKKMKECFFHRFIFQFHNSVILNP